MAQAQRLVLVNVGNVEIANALDLVGVSIFAASAQRCHELRVRREVLLNGLLIAAVHDNDFIGARCQALFDHILNNRAVDHKQHFFRLSLSGGKEARAHARSGNQSLQRTSPIWENDAPRTAARSIAWVYCTTLERRAGKAQKGCTRTRTSTAANGHRAPHRQAHPCLRERKSGRRPWHPPPQSHIRKKPGQRAISSQQATLRHAPQARQASFRCSSTSWWS